MSTPEQRRSAASLAANVSWAKTANWSERTAPARAARDQKFLDQVPPEITDPVQRAKIAEAARRAHYQRMARASHAARRANSAAKRAA
ncbi:hypothetical protein ABZ249_25530 [Nocardiopsis sp. NPDC006139]|uniref:hypothetical protein n=1 Tax=Nocardiopsis sp. NPDC006139 TaxID=3154578 RepID=UPI0033B45651